MSRKRMIFWALIAAVVIIGGLSVRNHDLRVSRRAEQAATDRQEGMGDWTPEESRRFREIYGRR